jgi:hypothetical protein
VRYTGLAPANVLPRLYSMSSRNVFLLPSGRRIKLSSPKNTRKNRPLNADSVVTVALLPETPLPAIYAPTPALVPAPASAAAPASAPASAASAPTPAASASAASSASALTSAPVLPAAGANSRTGPARRFNVTDFLAQIAIDPYLYHFLFGDDSDEDSGESSPEPAPLPPLDASGRLPRVPLHFADECVVCADAVPVMCAYPCGHVCVCCDCAAELQSRRIITCGVCRTPVSNYVLTDDVAIES